MRRKLTPIWPYLLTGLVAGIILAVLLMVHEPKVRGWVGVRMTVSLCFLTTVIAVGPWLIRNDLDLYP